MDTCPICNCRLDLLTVSLEKHVNDCIDLTEIRSIKKNINPSQIDNHTKQSKLSQFKIPENELDKSNTPASSQRYTHCPICNKNLIRMSKKLQLSHLERCCNDIVASNPIGSKNLSKFNSKLLSKCVFCNNSWESIFYSGNTTSIYENSLAIGTPALFSPTHNYLNHLFECASKSEICPTEIISDSGHENFSSLIVKNQASQSGTIPNKHQFFSIKNDQSTSKKVENPYLKQKTKQNNFFDLKSTDISSIRKKDDSSLKLDSHADQIHLKKLSKAQNASKYNDNSNLNQLNYTKHLENINDFSRKDNFSPNASKKSDSDGLKNFFSVRKTISLSSISSISSSEKSCDFSKKLAFPQISGLNGKSKNKNINKNTSKIKNKKKEFELPQELDEELQTGLALSASLSYINSNDNIYDENCEGSLISTSKPVESLANSVFSILGNQMSKSSKNSSVKSLKKNSKAYQNENLRSDILPVNEGLSYLQHRASALKDLDKNDERPLNFTSNPNPFPLSKDSDSNYIDLNSRVIQLDCSTALTHDTPTVSQTTKKRSNNRDVDHESLNHSPKIPSLWSYSSRDIAEDNEAYITAVFDLIKYKKKIISEFPQTNLSFNSFEKPSFENYSVISLDKDFKSMSFVPSKYDELEVARGHNSPNSLQNDLSGLEKYPFEINTKAEINLCISDNDELEISDFNYKPSSFKALNEKTSLSSEVNKLLNISSEKYKQSKVIADFPSMTKKNTGYLSSLKPISNSSLSDDSDDINEMISSFNEFSVAYDDSEISFTNFDTNFPSTENLNYKNTVDISQLPKPNTREYFQLKQRDDTSSISSPSQSVYPTSDKNNALEYSLIKSNAPNINTNLSSTNRPSYDNMTIKQLKDEAKKYGLKTRVQTDSSISFAKSQRAKPNKSIVTNYQSSLGSKSPELTNREDTGLSKDEQIYKFIFENKELYTSVLLYRAIDVDELLDDLASSGVKCSKAYLKQFLDNQGVCNMSAKDTQVRNERGNRRY
ncbi:hypothetical protein AYI70_g7443 [Smittium culicis]|uniref:Structure-specific endonuclease subunit SLX4 n=1 Tax=Smittium culicis TaxID=133412 RepID=A0A1R1XKL7_9FUNG|nr:hypothetical protein AYI70_g7443 [Smittium culicis]